MTVYSQSTPIARQKIRAEMLKLVKDSVRRKFPLLNRNEIDLAARRIVAEALEKEHALEQSESSNAQQPAIQ